MNLYFKLLIQGLDSVHHLSYHALPTAAEDPIHTRQQRINSPCLRLVPTAVTRVRGSCDAPAPTGDFLPVLLLLIEFSHNGKKSADEGVAGTLLVSLGSQKTASPFCIN